MTWTLILCCTQKSEPVFPQMPRQHGNSVKCRFCEPTAGLVTRWNFKISSFTALTHKQHSLNGTDKGTESITGMGLTSLTCGMKIQPDVLCSPKLLVCCHFRATSIVLLHSKLADNKSLVVIA